MTRLSRPRILLVNIIHTEPPRSLLPLPPPSPPHSPPGNDLCGISAYDSHPGVGALYDTSGVKALAEALRRSTLTSLDISRNQVGLKEDIWSLTCVGGTTELADSLRENEYLTNLDLSSNFIGVNSLGFMHLGRALEHNVTLTSLNLSGNALCAMYVWQKREREKGREGECVLQ